MRKNIEKVATIFLFLLPYLSYLNYFLPSGLVRVTTLLLFFAPFAVLIISQRMGLDKKLTIFSLAAIAAIVFIGRNMPRLNTFMSGLEISDTRTLAEMYIENGAMVFPDSHSFFPQTGVILYFLSTICGIDLVQSSIIIIIAHLTLLSLVSFYAIEIILESTQNRTLQIVSIIGVVSASVSNNIMHTRMNYRILASPLFLLLILYMYRRYYGDTPRLAYIPITVLLSIGVTLGDPTSALIMIPFFILLSYIGDRKIDFLYALIPLSYLTYSATSYIIAIRRYSRFAISGVIEFINSLILREFPERILPWRRTTSLSLWDTYVTSLGFVSLLLVSGIIGLYYSILWLRSKDPLSISGKKLLENTAGLTLLSMTGVAGLTYIGASVRPEVAFSDIRTIAMLFAASLLAFSIIPRMFSDLLGRKKILPIVFTLLFLFTSLRIVYGGYPKSIYDPPNILEDTRLGSDSVFIYADFHNEYYKTGGIVIDWKTHNRIQEAIQETEYERRWIDANTLDYPFASNPQKSIIVFNQVGTEIPSLYHNLEAYQAAYNYSLTHNRIYDNGIVIAAQREGR